MSDDLCYELENRWRALGDAYWTQADGPPIVTEHDVISRAEKTRTSAGAVLDELALQLAQGFCEGRLDFLFCDAVVNDLYLLAINLHPLNAANGFFQIFNAFDEGEYHHMGRPLDENPVETYTRPMLLKALKEWRQA
ncbi:hypothetical protein [Asticcacaulis excentricus]|uniref:hypothetical protein n=1 Tax=Asticcacaulis excentricus TaxID=78587 RepID=UPI000F837E9D|nr:hypothetical protein [Asticcacaulis excentricus]